MMYRLTQGINSYTGATRFYVYERKNDEPDNWYYSFGDDDEAQCRAFIERRLKPQDEKVIEEFEG